MYRISKYYYIQYIFTDQYSIVKNSCNTVHNPLMYLTPDQSKYVASAYQKIRSEAYKKEQNISTENAGTHLFQCAQNKLGNHMLANGPRLLT